MSVRDRSGDREDVVVAALHALAPHLDGEPDPAFRAATRARLVAMAAVRTPEPEPVSPACGGCSPAARDDAGPAALAHPADRRPGRRRPDRDRAARRWSRWPPTPRPGDVALRPQARHRADPARPGRRRPRADAARLRQHPARRAARTLVDDADRAAGRRCGRRLGRHAAGRRRRPRAGDRDARDDGRPDHRGHRLADRPRGHDRGRRTAGRPGRLGRRADRRAGRPRAASCPSGRRRRGGPLAGPARRRSRAHRRPAGAPWPAPPARRSAGTDALGPVPGALRARAGATRRHGGGDPGTGATGPPGTDRGPDGPAGRRRRSPAAAPGSGAGATGGTGTGGGTRRRRRPGADGTAGDPRRAAGRRSRACPRRSCRPADLGACRAATLPGTLLERAVHRPAGWTSCLPPLATIGDC